MGKGKRTKDKQSRTQCYTNPNKENRAELIYDIQLLFIGYDKMVETGRQQNDVETATLLPFFTCMFC